MNGLEGRMLKLPALGKYKQEILIISGHHTSIERMLGVAEYVSQYGSVTVPDLPGFGGMQPFYKIGEKPTIDNMADYLASFVKLRYRGRRFSVVGMSYGFSVVVRMLQKYPEVTKKIDLCISVSGLVHKDDFRWKRSTFYTLRWLASIFSNRIPSAFVKYVGLRGPVIRFCYRLIENPKLGDQSPEEREKRIRFEIKLWQSNDIRTYTSTAVTMLILNLLGAKVNLPVYHVAPDDDMYFDSKVVEEHLSQIFTSVNMVPTKWPSHVPTVVATVKDVIPFIPPKIRDLLRKNGKINLY